MKVIIGLVGEKGGGKGKFTEMLIELLDEAGKKTAHARFSDILVETLKLWHLPNTRENLQKLSVIMRDAYGKGTLTNAVRQRLESLAADFVILDGIRWESDVELLRSFPHSLLIYIYADPEIRLERIRKRKEKSGEENTTLEQFLQQEQAETEKMIPAIGLTANLKIVNNSKDPEELKAVVQHFLATFLCPYLS